jgi:hypothetical protein
VLLFWASFALFILFSFFSCVAPLRATTPSEEAGQQSNLPWHCWLLLGRLIEQVGAKSKASIERLVETDLHLCRPVFISLEASVCCQSASTSKAFQGHLHGVKVVQQQV